MLALASASITGPDIGGETARIAHTAFGHCTAQHLQRVVGHVILQAQHAQGGAALAGAVEGGSQNVPPTTTCSVSAEESTIMAFMPPVSAMSGVGRPCASRRVAMLALQQGGHFGRAGEHHAAHAVIGGELRTDGFPPARQQLNHARRNATLQKNVDAPGRQSAGFVLPVLPARCCPHNAVTSSDQAD